MKNSGSSGRREMVEGEDINYYDVDVEVEWGIVLTELKQPMRWKRGAPPAAERIVDVLEQG